MDLRRLLKDLPEVDHGQDDLIVIEGDVIGVTEKTIRFVVRDVCFDFLIKDIVSIDLLHNLEEKFSVRARLFIRKGCAIQDIFLGGHYEPLVYPRKKPFALAIRAESKYDHFSETDLLTKKFLQKYGINF